MKKASTILTAMLPVMYLMAIGLSIVINPNDETLFLILGSYMLIGLLLPCLLFLFTAQAARKFLSIGNIWIIVGNLVLFIAEIVYWLIALKETQIAEANGAMGGGLGLVLLIILYLPHWITYLCSRIVVSINCHRASKGICAQEIRALHALLHLLPVTDLASAIWIHYKVKNAG